MIPSRRLLQLLAAWLVLSVLASLWPRFAPLWKIGAGFVAGIAALDAVIVSLSRRLTVRREVPGRLALGVGIEIPLTLHNPNTRTVNTEFFDGLPETVGSTQLPWSGTVIGGGHTTVLYTVRPLARGAVTFTECHLRHASPLGLWWRRYRAGSKADSRVYPDYEPVVRYTLLAMSNRESQMGIVSKNRVGQSREFHQLREYQDGDVLSQLDWKATARRGQLVSREYREQKDQTLIFLLDCGRRMRTPDGALPQFDHCLNATLLLSYIALKQGDRVGVMGFGGTTRWLPPVKGQHSMAGILNHLYDYECTAAPSDFSEAAERLMARHGRRALVVLLTNLRTEDSSHLLAPLRLLRRRHLVVVASLREKSVVERMSAPVMNFDEALLAAAGQGYLAERSALLANLRDHGVLTLDETAASLPSALANAYHDIKRRGAL